MKNIIALLIILTLLLTGQTLFAQSETLSTCNEVDDAFFRDFAELQDLQARWLEGNFNNGQDFWVLRDMRVRYEMANCAEALPFVFSQYIAGYQDIYIGLIMEDEPNVIISINRSTDLAELLTAILKK